MLCAYVLSTTIGVVGWYALRQLSERWPYHIWPGGKIKFTSLEANLGGGWGLLVYHILFSLLLSGRSPDMVEILLTGILSLNSIKVPLSHSLANLFEGVYNGS